MKLSNTVVVACLLFGVSGCMTDSNYSDLERQMEEIRKRPKGHIEQPPELKTYESYNYSAAARRSPFSPPTQIEEMEVQQGSRDIRPDLDRPREQLESFSIDGLRMVGTLRRPDEQLYALVRDPQGSLHRVQEGNYLGRNHGRITRIRENRVDVIEIVSDGMDGWLERPRTIALKGHD